MYYGNIVPILTWMPELAVSWTEGMNSAFCLRHSSTSQWAEKMSLTKSTLRCVMSPWHCLKPVAPKSWSKWNTSCGIWWLCCEELQDMLNWLNANQLSAGPGSPTWKWKSSELVIVVSQGVLLQWGFLVSVEENPLNTLLKLPLLRVLLYQGFLQDLLPAKAFKDASQKRCNGLADSSRS